MLSLPTEVQIDVLKCLNFKQLFSFKRTNFYLRNLINKYGEGLARKGFYKLSLTVTKNIHIKSVEPDISEFILTDQLRVKWEKALVESIPLFLHGVRDDNQDIESIAVEMLRMRNAFYFLILPNIPKTIEEMVIARYWLKTTF
uniref:F-box domain-containing protein n=1 Tax=Meloidogyne enterolobii TaxID=390850 RepID=A0A6V7TW22_MELEN|nr:unnamed protein product [Meloidogyne enterolobii]